MTDIEREAIAELAAEEHRAAVETAKARILLKRRQHKEVRDFAMEGLWLGVCVGGLFGFIAALFITLFINGALHHV